MGERDEEFAYGLGKAWQYIKGDGLYTGRELKEYINTMDSSLCRQVLQAIIQTAWTDYGGKTPQLPDSTEAEIKLCRRCGR